MNQLRTRVWVHHSASAFPRDPRWTEKLLRWRAKAFIREMQRFHQETRGWNDIAYTFIIMRGYFGRMWVFEGRGWGIVGAHTEGDNSGAHGVCFVGNFDTERPHKLAMRACRILLDRGVKRGQITALRTAVPTGGHRDAPGAATACPGTNLYSRIDDLRRPA